MLSSLFGCINFPASGHTAVWQVVRVPCAVMAWGLLSEANVDVTAKFGASVQDYDPL